MFHELHHRTFFKSVTWMVTAYLITVIVLYLIEGDWAKASWHALVVQLIKFVFFYLHERIWNKTNFGQQLRIKEALKLGKK